MTGDCPVCGIHPDDDARHTEWVHELHEKRVHAGDAEGAALAACHAALAEQRHRQENFATRRAAGHSVDPLAAIPGPAAARVELANIRRLVERHGVPPAGGNGEPRSTVAMVEEALIRRPPVDTEPDWVASRYLLDHPTPGGPHG